MRKPLTAQDVAWISRQFKHPKPAYLVAELLRLCSQDVKHEWLRTKLIEKGVIAPKIGKGREHVVYYSKLKALWPAFWLSAKRAWTDALSRSDEPEDDVA